jgi:hypothetical protein
MMPEEAELLKLRARVDVLEEQVHCLQMSATKGIDSLRELEIHPGDIGLIEEIAEGAHHGDCDVDRHRCTCAVHVAEAALRLLQNMRGDYERSYDDAEKRKP